MTQVMRGRHLTVIDDPALASVRNVFDEGPGTTCRPSTINLGQTDLIKWHTYMVTK